MITGIILASNQTISDQVALREFGAGAMENWGLVLYDDTRLLVHPNYTSFYDMYRFSKTMSHELVHMVIFISLYHLCMCIIMLWLRNRDMLRTDSTHYGWVMLEEFGKYMNTNLAHTHTLSCMYKMSTLFTMLQN